MNAAIVGFGYMGSMYAELLTSRNWNLVGVHDSDPDKFKGVAAAPYYRDRRELISRSDVKVVIISTPHNQHLEVLKECLEFKKHVILEKPLAGSLKEAEEVYALVRRHAAHSCVMVNITHCFYDAIQEAKQLLAVKDIGTITSISDRVIFPIKAEESSWWLFKRAVVEHGVMLTNGCHLVARLLHLFSAFRLKVEFVGGIFANTDKLGDIADSAASMRANLLLSDGRKIPVTFFASWPMMDKAGKAVQESMVIKTNQGKLHVQAFNGVTFHSDSNKPLAHEVPFDRDSITDEIKKGVKNMLALFEKEVAQKTNEVRFSVEYTYQAEKIIGKLYEADHSSKTARPSRMVQALDLELLRPPLELLE